MTALAPIVGSQYNEMICNVGGPNVGTGPVGTSIVRHPMWGPL